MSCSPERKDMRFVDMEWKSNCPATGFGVVVVAVKTVLVDSVTLEVGVPTTPETAEYEDDA